MASVSYPVSNITAGVSTQEYSLRLDGQASEQRNVLNSPRYGLCKRPNSHYLAGLEVGSWAAPLVIPLTYGAVENLFVAGVNTPKTIRTSTGASTDVCLFPSSSAVGTSAWQAYKAGTGSVASYPNEFAHVRVGDVTFIANKTRQPAMSNDLWLGYNSATDVTNGGTAVVQGDGADTTTVTNNDVWAATIKQFDPNQKEDFSITWSEKIGATTSEYSVKVARTDTTYEPDTDHDALDEPSASNIKHVAAKLAYGVSAKQNGNTHNMMQATSLATVSYSAGSNSVENTSGTTSIMGRYTNQTGTTPGSLSSIESETSRDNDFIDLAWKEVKSLADLPPRSWESHTLKVSAEDETPYGFYMKFVTDEESPVLRSHAVDSTSGTQYAQFTSSSMLPRKGHWEESCAVDIETTVDSTTMPHMLVRRPDGSFAFMEARGSFVVNSANLNVTFEQDDDTFKPTAFDGGFTNDANTSPLVIGDTVEFSAGTLPPELSLDTTYYIKTKSYDSGWKYTISLTDGGDPVTFSDATPSDCTVKLTTYKNLTYSDRIAGDDTTNKLPDFFTNPIEGLFSYQDRLGIFTENEITLSGTDAEFTFFRTTVRSLLDSDRLKVRPSQADNESILQVLPFKSALMIMTNRKQLMMYGNDGSLSPGTITVAEASAVETDTYTTPVAVGDSLYAAYSAGFGGGMYELFPESESGFASRDVSLQVPGYLPEGPRALRASSKHNMIFWLDDGSGSNAEIADRERIFVYTFDQSGPNKTQSAWTKWSFNYNNTTGAAGYHIHNMVTMGDRLYLIVESNGHVIIEYIDLDILVPQTDLDDTTEAAFAGVMLDRLTSFTPASASEVVLNSGNTEITVPWEILDTTAMDDNLRIVATSNAGATTVYTPTSISSSTTSSTKLTLNSTDLKNGHAKVWVGFNYDMIHTLGPFSPVIGERAVRGRNVFVRGGRMTYSKLNTLGITVEGRTQTISAGGTATKQGEEFFAVGQKVEDLSVTLTNSTPWQSMVQGITYDLNIQEGMNQAVWR